MEQIGKRVYYDNATGNVIFEINEQTHYGERVEQTVERDIESIKILSERNRATFDVLQLQYGQYAQDFAQCNGYRVNPATLLLEFSYPDPNAPQEPPVYRQPLSEEVATLKERDTLMQADITAIIELLGG